MGLTGFSVSVIIEQRNLLRKVVEFHKYILSNKLFIQSNL